MNAIACIDRVIKESAMNKEQINRVLLVGGSSKIPLIQKLILNFFKETKPILTMYPVEAVTYGAAIEAFNLS